MGYRYVTNVTAAPRAVMSAPGAEAECVKPRVGRTWGQLLLSEAPVRPDPLPCPGHGLYYISAKGLVQCRMKMRI